MIADLSLCYFLFFKRRNVGSLLQLLVLSILLSFSVSGPSGTQASHVMTSDSREEPEFEMVSEGSESLRKKEIVEDEEDTDFKVPKAGQVLPPIPTFKHPPPIPTELDKELVVELDKKTEKLRKIDELSKTGVSTEGCLGPSEVEMMQGVHLSTEFANVIMEKVDMVVSFLYKLKKYEQRVKNKKEVERDEQEVYRYALETIKEAYPLQDLRLLIYNQQSQEQSIYKLTQSQIGETTSYNLTRDKEKIGDLSRKPWFFDPNVEFDHEKWIGPSDRDSENYDAPKKSAYHKNRLMDSEMSGGSYWTWAYFNCSSTKNRKLYTESELEIHSSSDTKSYYLPPTRDDYNANSRRSNSNSNRDQSGHHFFYQQKNKRATYKGHPVHVSHGHLFQLHKTHLQHKLDLKNAWVGSYTAWFPIRRKDRKIEEFGELSIDLDLSKFEINQCGFEDEGRREWDSKENPLHYFRDTHKCDRLKGTSTCHFIPGHPWRLGSYECRCGKNKYAYQRELNNTISGAIAEAAWNTMRENKTNGMFSVVSYQDIVTCKRCPDGCDNCVEGTSCLAPVSWVFRMVLLIISILCSIGSVSLVFVTYRFRKTPVLKSSSPLFHCITLLGCVIMYSEMIVLFPVLTQANCIAVKWTRHLGFCVTYTALYMKLCRVFLTFRVKSAHRVKLTEKHLLHWMSPIMVIMLLYLFAWSISDPPGVEQLITTDDLKFAQCVYNWWDHALAFGEVVFLLYGIWICWRIRENPDARFISYSIYNIALTNFVMVSFHLIILPQAGPDTKYLLAFLRVQFSTTVTIALVFGSKLLSVLTGDPKAMKDIPTSANGFGHETLDLAEENQQLKEELTKMATQIEKLRSYAMCKNNPHLKQSSANITAADADFNKADPLSSL